MPENQLRIDTDRGYVLCTTSCAAFVGDGEVQIVHQVDADTGFDLAPMDAGGAFWAEQDLLARRAPGANSLEIANRVEDLITHVYRTATRVDGDPCRARRRRPRDLGDAGAGGHRARPARRARRQSSSPAGALVGALHPDSARRGDHRAARRARPLPHARRTTARSRSCASCASRT